LYAVYKKLKNRSFEHFYIKLRGRFGAIPLERADTFKQLVSDHQKGIPSMSAFLFDQTPRSNDIHHWITFLNQDTPVVLGAEKVAQKLDAVVLFLYSRKIKRGHYETEFQLVTDHAKACQRFEITDKCNYLLEQQIKEHPEFWLWSHKRWKHKRDQVVTHDQNITVLQTS
jgi:KDO2-lipid IV(A) lauroyltransferase